VSVLRRFSELSYADLLGRFGSELPEEEDTQTDQRNNQKNHRNNKITPALAWRIVIEFHKKEIGRDQSR
jgi:hypothetical protein